LLLRSEMILSGKQALRHCGEQDQDDPGVTLHRYSSIHKLDKPASSFFLFLFRHGHREFRNRSNNHIHGYA
jgi:hypothetical protein